MDKQLYLPAPDTILCLPEPQITIPQWMIDLLDKAQEHAFEVMVEQMEINPYAFEALYW
jgi:hypothetical protein